MTDEDRDKQPNIQNLANEHADQMKKHTLIPH